MKKLVTVKFPKNISNDDKFMYEPYLSYELAPLTIKKLKNVFVSFSGFCLNSRGLIRECHHDYSTQQNDYLDEVFTYYYSALDNPESLITLDNENCYLVIHHPWFNYYHWVCESLLRMWMVRKQKDKLILILPDFYKNADFIMGSLEPFHIKNIFYIPKGKSLLVRNLCLPQIKPKCDSYDYVQLDRMRRFYRNYVLIEKKISVSKIDKLYISRKLAGRRQIINEDEILPIIIKHGFTIFYPEKFSFLEQVAVFVNVKYLIGTHGSGLTNLLFMNKYSSVLELHKNKTNELNHPSPLFWYMAAALEISYFHQLCETYGKEDYFTGDYIVDVRLFEENLSAMLCC
jgi:hypothetical protein